VAEICNKDQVACYAKVVAFIFFYLKKICNVTFLN